MNDLTHKTDAQLRAEKAAILRELSARRKAAKPKVRQQRSQAERERARLWNKMLRDATNCEACGRAPTDRPVWWGAEDYCLDRAHVIGGTGWRVQDRRLCVILCRACHHQQTTGVKVVGCDVEPLTLANLHWLKALHADYDPTFLRRHSNKPLPTPVELPGKYFISTYKFWGKRRDDEALSHQH